MSNHEFKFNVYQLVSVDGVECYVDEREIYDGEPDYLLYPTGSFRGLTSKGNELPGWIRTKQIETKETENE